MARAVLLFDEDCGFCRWATDKVLGWDRRGVLRAVPIQSEEGDRLLGAMSDRRRLGSWHLAVPGRPVASGGAAVAPLATMLPLGRPIALLARWFPATTEALYGFVSRHRGRLAGIVGAGACRVDPMRRR